jgi:hypothetical protein
MTDRFYPLGMPSSHEAWKTSYEVQNELRSYERSAYPPGTSIHMPGARERFGYGSPGPIAHRLSKSNLALSEQVDIANPREHYAIPRLQEPDDLTTFKKLDVPEMQRSYRSPMAMTTLSPGSRMTVSRSLPMLQQKRPAPPKLREPNQPVNKLEDQHFCYYVPKGMQRDGREKLCSTPMHKLPKDNKISFPFSGEGTGFGGQKHGTTWWPAPTASYSADMTAYRTGFTKPDFHRSSPLFYQPSR